MTKLVDPAFLAEKVTTQCLTTVHAAFPPNPQTRSPCHTSRSALGSGGRQESSGGLVLWCEFPVARGPGSMGARMVNDGAGARSFSEEVKSDGKRKKVRRNW